MLFFIVGVIIEENRNGAKMYFWPLHAFALCDVEAYNVRCLKACSKVMR